jgi:kinesin family protein 18/19
LLVEHPTQLQLRDDGTGGTVVAGLTHQEPVSAEHVFALLEVGNARRRQSPTDANAESSRSHAVLQIAVEQRARTAGLETERRVAKLCMIDLAGSERAAASGNRGQLMREGANINKSLLALGNCINVLCQSGTNAHVPYRDSKLTRLLKDSLGGNCRTVMIATISPSSLCIEDSLNTLRYANRAKNIKCNVQSNVVVARARVHEYGELITALREEVAHWKARANGSDGSTSQSQQQQQHPHQQHQQQQQQMHTSTTGETFKPVQHASHAIARRVSRATRPPLPQFGSRIGASVRC